MRDLLCYHLVGYIADYINKKFISAYPTSNIKIVRSVRAFNAMGIAIDQLPLLKAYRLQDTYKYRTTHYTSQISIDYLVPYPYIENLSGILPFVSETLVEAFFSYQRSYKLNSPETNSQITIDYVYQSEAYQEIVQGFKAIIVLDKLPYSYLTPNAVRP
ncbi:MAG: hypothetical protein ACK4NC_07215 [Candidatus Gracilibacteria bacterium]